MKQKQGKKDKDHMIDFSTKIGLSFKEVNKWLWDKEQRERALEIEKTRDFRKNVG